MNTCNKAYDRYLYVIGAASGGFVTFALTHWVGEVWTFLPLASVALYASYLSDTLEYPFTSIQDD